MSHESDLAGAARLDAQLAEYDGKQPSRRTIKIPASLYAEIARDAGAIGLAAQAYAVSLLTRALEMDRITETIPASRRNAMSYHGDSDTAEPERRVGYSNSELAARIVAEGSPSPTLAGAQRRATDFREDPVPPHAMTQAEYAEWLERQARQDRGENQISEPPRRKRERDPLSLEASNYLQSQKG